MPRLALPQITLCAADTRAPAMAAAALRQSMANIDFGRVVLFTHGWSLQPAHGDIETVDIGPLRSGADYSHFVLRVLPTHVHTPHVLVTQWDGFVVHPQAWTDGFLEWDYVGAVWSDQPAACCVGNGGFSLRSQRLLQAGLDPRIALEHPEDEMLARRYRQLLTQEHGVRFAPPALARRFAHENETPRAPTFGFHGPKNLPRVLDADTLRGWIDALPDAFYRQRDSRRLARALLHQGMLDLTSRVVARRQAVGRREPATRLLGWAAAGLSVALPLLSRTEKRPGD